MIKFIREKWNSEAYFDLAKLLTAHDLDYYSRMVYAEQISLYGFYMDDERVGSALTQIVEKDGEKSLVCMELAGKDLPAVGFYFPFFCALGKKAGCDKFVLATARKGLMRLAENQGFKIKFAEYEKEISEVL